MEDMQFIPCKRSPPKKKHQKKGKKNWNRRKLGKGQKMPNPFGEITIKCCHQFEVEK